MTDGHPFLPGMSRETFFAAYFRRTPFVLRGAARTLLEPPLSVAEFEENRARMAREHPVQVVERPGEARFVRVTDLASPRLAAVSDTVRHALDWPNVWCDAVRTLAPSGIGCHFDDSDNLVLQQEGTKRWQLAPPSGLPEDSLRRRMTGDHTVGTAYMPDDALEFVLAPGDVLYLPVFWSHWGVSEGPSLSISVALNSASALQTVLPLLGEELAAHRAWWQPLAPGEPDLDALWQALDDPALRHRIGETLRVRHRAGVRHGLHAPRTRPATEPEQDDDTRPQLLAITLRGPLRDLLRRTPDLPDAHALLAAPLSGTLWADARREHARHVLLRVLRLLRHRSGHWDGQPGILRTAQTVVDLLAAAEETELLALGRHPVLLGAVRRAEREAAADYWEPADTFVPHVASAVLGIAARHPGTAAGRPLTAAPSEPHGIAVLLPGERWTVPGTLGDTTAVRFDPQDGTPELRTADGTWQQATRTPLTTTGRSDLRLLTHHTWWQTAEQLGISWHCGRLPDHETDTAADAVALLAAHWPAALAAAEAHLLLFTGPAPAERLALTACSPPAVEAAAAGLVTVLARAQWRLLTDLRPPPDGLPPLPSPWDGSAHSAPWVYGQLHAARLQGEFCRRLPGAAPWTDAVLADVARATAAVRAAAPADLALADAVLQDTDHTPTGSTPSR
ncbi:hypothetical protein LKL35_27015 [Streptomyces sp. ET3-23]|uniref:JmjC domain-containing protein n=1 Tax=Streptomyces sp. ET3-23 TaxID=2885643 RepID=UPI001D12249A|nr:cupin domain-containing protein [Streptomyces sp. ET3-23]MCC2279052.1 hypothetical protein [Streptomyces sp. ET3-23]